MRGLWTLAKYAKIPALIEEKLFSPSHKMNIADIKNAIMFKREKELIEALQSGWDPNYEGGWPIRLAARYGCYSIVELLIMHGANPHLLSESGASTLQLAVYSSEHWETNRWNLLLSCCDSSQLADGAAVAIVFNNTLALHKILETGRCNIHIPTTLTGRTLEQLAKGYKLTHLLSTPVLNTQRSNESTHSISPRNLLPSSPRTLHENSHRMLHASSPRDLHSSLPRPGRQNRSEIRNTLMPQQHQRNLSPSVARFFQQTAGQSSLTSPVRTVDASSPSGYLRN